MNLRFHFLSHTLRFGLLAAVVLIQSSVLAANALAQTRAPTTLYVSPSGNASDGLSLETAFRTINAAASVTIPGDTVIVKAGTYTLETNAQNPSAFENPVVYIGRSGTKDAYITFKAFPGDRPKIKSLGNIAGVVFDGVSFINFEGFELEGNSPDDTAEGRAKGLSVLCNRFNFSPDTNDAQASGFVAQTFSGGRASVEALAKLSHHITLRNNVIHRWGGGGIQTLYADYITIEGNVIYRNAFYNPYAASGISLYQQQDLEAAKTRYQQLPANPGQTLKNVIRGNVVFDNKNVFGTAILAGNDQTQCDRDAAITDGNGIIFDDSWHEQSAVNEFKKAHYRGRTRIENNIVYGNGARGINVYSSSYVDVVNNTLYRNGQTQLIDPARYADGFSEVSSVDSDHVTFFNNIISAIPGKRINTAGATYNDQPATNRLSNNLIVGGGAFNALTGTNNLIGQDPLFRNAEGRNFELREASPAIDKGATSVDGILAASTDVLGTPRPQRSGIDLGAFELKPASVALTNGLYRITSACNGKVLGIENGNPNPWDNVVVKSVGATGAIAWQVSADANGTYALTVPNTNSVMQAADANTVSQNNVDLWSDWGGAPQRWQIASAGDGFYRLTLAANNALSLDLTNAGQTGETNVWLYTTNDTCAQRWKFEPSAAVAGANVTVKYDSDDTLFPNPGRGAAVMYGNTAVTENLPPLRNSAQYFRSQRDQFGASVIQSNYYLGAWKYGDIPQSFLDLLQQDFDGARELGFKLIPHFSYAYTFNYPWQGIETEKDASADIMVRHLQQMSPVLKKNGDVLAFFFPGMIGTWGEQWNSYSNNITLAQTSGVGSTVNDNTRKIFRAMLDAIPADRMVVVRNRSLKTSWLGDMTPLNRQTAWRNTDRARMGFDNQCFMGDDTDGGANGTYKDGGTSGPWSYMNEEGKYVPLLGFTDPNCGDGVSTEAQMRMEMYASNWDLFGGPQDISAMLGGASEAVVRNLVRDMGYRYRLVSATLPQTASPGDSINASIEMTNDGSGSEYNPRGIELILRNQATGETFALKIADDNQGNRSHLPMPRTTTTLSFSGALPATLRQGSYELLLNLPDPAPSIYGNPFFSVRLANQNVWEANTGYNKLNATLTLQ